MGSRTASCCCGQLRIEVPSFPAPKDSVYDCRRHAWVELPPGATAYDKDPP